MSYAPIVVKIALFSTNNSPLACCNRNDFVSVYPYVE